MHSRTLRLIQLFLLLAGIALVGCGGGGGASTTVKSDEASNESPVIADILTDIRLIPQESGGVTRVPFESLKFFIEVKVTDPEGLADIDYIDVEHPGGTLYWTLYESERFGSYRADCRYDNSDVYGCLFYDINSPHSIELQGWKLVVKDKAGNETTKDFDFKLPSGIQPTSERFVYTEFYSGHTVNGVETLKRPKNFSVISWHGTQSFEFEFTVEDPRVVMYGIEFWVADDALNEWVFAGGLHSESPSISSTALVQGNNVVSVSVSVPWSEIQLNGSYTVDDIGGFHVVAFDEPEYFANGGGWHNYLSTSDFLDRRFLK